MIEFKKGIIEGRIDAGVLTVNLENKLISDTIIHIHFNDIENFLKEHDYIVYKKKGSKDIRFEKIFIDNRLQDYLDITGRTQTFLANKLNLDRSAISRLCKAKNIELQTAYKICKIINADINSVFPPKNLKYLEF